MTLDEYFKVFDKRAFDPNEFVKVTIGGKECSVRHVASTNAKKYSNKKHRAKHRESEAARVAEWRKGNPDKVRTQAEARGSRNYHRPFVTIDGEGQDFPGADLLDGNGNVYPLHRTVLWGAGGWMRRNSASQLAQGIGDPREGFELKSNWLGDNTKRPPGSDEIIEWLLSLPEKYGPDQGFPDGVNFVAFSFNYDVTQILADLPFHKSWEISRKKIFGTNKKTKYPTLYKQYAIDYLKSKWLKIWELRDPENPYKPKLDRNGEVKLKSNGKPEMEIDAINYICIDDTFGFYQSKFITATKPLIKQGYMAEADYKEIENQKENRSEFDRQPIEQIKHYCNLELVTLSKALTVLRDGFDKMNIRLRNWTGAGSPAASLIRAKGLKKDHYSPDIAVANITRQQEQAHRAFVGGRIEPIKQGFAMQRDLWLYDIASAYPNAMLGLPSMRDGEWKFHGSIPGGDLEEVASGSNVLSMFRIKWKFPDKGVDGKSIPFNPFPYRTKRGSILFPGAGHAWIMRDEIIAGLKWVKKFGLDADMIVVEEWSEFIPGNDEKPYAFVAELYEMRRQAKSQKEYDIVEKAIKLCINSLYGKTVQSVGGTDDAPPACACPYYGAATTANCRARLLEAAILDPHSIVTFMTDGIVSTRELKGLPRAKEIFEGDPPEGVTIDLGDWEFEKMAGGFFLMSGVYCIVHISGETKDRTRGANPMNFVFKKALQDLLLNDVLPEWKSNPAHAN